MMYMYTVEPRYTEFGFPWTGLSLVLCFDDCSQIPVRKYENRSKREGGREGKREGEREGGREGKRVRGKEGGRDGIIFNTNTPLYLRTYVRT